MANQTATFANIFDPSQQAAYDKLVDVGGGIVWMNVGDGKTRVGLVAAEDIKEKPVTLVVARRAAFYDWRMEVATLQLGCEIKELENVGYIDNLSEPTTLLVSEGKLANSITQDAIKYHYNEIGCIILDEGYLYKNPHSQRSKAIHPFTKEIPTILLSGSIMTARDLVDIYGQTAAVGAQHVLGGSLTKFRSRYQKGIQGNYFSWYPKPGAYKQIMEAIEPFTYIHMPEVSTVKHVDRIYKVAATPEQASYIKELKETAAVEGFFELTSMGAVVIKAQQISNGWLKREGGDVTYFPSTKIDRCMALLAELLETQYKVVVWCAFREDIARLRYQIAHDFAPMPVATLQSGKDFDHKLWANPKCRICLATEASGSSVNHFAQVPYAIYFSQDWKWHSLQQSQGRHTRRSSQHDTAYFLFLHTDKTFDSQVYYTVRQSKWSEKSFIQQMDVLQWLKQK